VSYYFKSIKQLKELSLNRPHLHKKEKTNLRGEKKTEAVIRIKAALINSTIPLHVTAHRLKLTRAIAENQERQTKTSVKCVTRKATTRKTVPCSSKSDLTVPKKKDYSQAL
jgi:hypothetical protein